MINQQLVSMAAELKGTGGGDALAVVIKACKMLEMERGSLDFNNTKLAVFALLQAITPEWRHADVILSLANCVNEE